MRQSTATLAILISAVLSSGVSAQTAHFTSGTLSNVAITSSTIDSSSIGSSTPSPSITGSQIYAGGAHAGNTTVGSGTWLETLVPGTIYPAITPRMSLSNPQGRMSADFIGGQSSTQLHDTTGFFPVVNAFSWLDSDPANNTGWAGYDESDITDGQNWVRSITREISAFSVRPTVPVNPFSSNPQDHVTLLRLDCGKGTGIRWVPGTYPAGSFVTGGSAGTPAQNCSSAFEIVNNGAQVNTGILFGSDALVTQADGQAEAISLAPSQAIKWHANGPNVNWFMTYVGSGSTSGNSIQLTDNSMTVSGFVVGKGVRAVPVSVAALPLCSSSTEGLFGSVTDATSTAFRAPLSGGGSSHVPVYCDGTSWTVH